MITTFKENNTLNQAPDSNLLKCCACSKVSYPSISHLLHHYGLNHLKPQAVEVHAYQLGCRWQ